MSLGKAGGILALVIAACAVFASSATATPETKSGKTWFKNGAEIPAGTDVAVDCHASGGTTITFHGTIAGAKITLTATGAQCLGGVITNDSSPMAATDRYQLRLTGVTLDEPAGCKVPSTLTTKELKGEIYGDSVVASRAYERVVPVEGTTLLTIPIEGCALAGSYPLKGVMFSRAASSTGVESASQEFISDEETNSFSEGLTLAGNPVSDTKDLVIQLVGTGTYKVQ